MVILSVREEPRPESAPAIKRWEGLRTSEVTRREMFAASIMTMMMMTTTLSPQISESGHRPIALSPMAYHSD
jgi:hypothetical protein